MSDETSHSHDREDTRRIIAGAIAEPDLQQIAVTRRLTPAQRFQEGLSMIRLAEQVGAYRLCLRRPELSQVEALHIIRSRERPPMGALPRGPDPQQATLFCDQPPTEARARHRQHSVHLEPELEMDYIALWAERLGLVEAWQEVLEEARRRSSARGTG